MKHEVTVNVDQYNNISRSFVLGKDPDTGEYAPEFVRIHSGSSGISIATKSSNNSHVYLSDDDVYTLMKELKLVVKFSKEARQDASAFWAAKNAFYNKAAEIKKMWEKK